MTRKTIIFAAFFMLLTFAFSVSAGCKQADMKGIWHDFVSSSNVGAVGNCIYRFGGNGAINTASVCYAFTATTDLPPVNITSGSFIVNSSCTITGTFDVSNGVSGWFAGQMDKSKNAFSGITRNSGGTIAMHNFVKQ